MSQKTILFINDWGSNPNERIFYIADYFKKQGGYQTFILGRNYSGLPERRDLVKITIPFLNSDKMIRSRIFRLLLRMIVITRAVYLIARFKPTYVYIRSIYLSYLFGKLKTGYKYKLLYETHGLAYKESSFKRGNSFKTILLKYLERQVIEILSDFIVVNTKALNENIRNEFSLKKPIVAISNGIDLEYFKSLPDSEWPDKPEGFIAGFIGNWEQWINIDELLEVSRLTDEIKIMVIGEGKDFKKYKQQYPRVLFTGKIPREKALSYLKYFDVCVSPWSNDPIFREKSARKTYEYLAAGKPIVVSDVPGKEDFLIPGENCIMYKSGDAKDLFNVLTKLKNDNQLRNTIGENNKKLAPNFSWMNIIHDSELAKIL